MKRRKINYKNIYSTYYRDNTILVLSDNISAPIETENLE